MASRLVDYSDCPCRRHRSEGAGVRGIALIFAFLFLGAALGVVLVYRAAHRGPSAVSESSGPQASPLSDTTLTVLHRLNSPLEIRFYSILDRATVPDSVTTFADRVNQLLSAYEQAADGKIKLTRIDTQSDLNSKAARADGVQAFNLDKGEACYLGIALSSMGRKESLPRFYPEWEQAVEPDLTRAILRLEEPVVAAGSVTAATPEINTNAVQEIRGLIPNLGDVSVEEGTRILREAALKDFTAAAKEMETQVKEAEQRLTQAKNGGSDADQQAAIKQLQQVQAEQTEKLKQIAARSQAQIDTLQQLKAKPH